MNATALSYFKAFASKDLPKLGELLAPNVSLRDWAVEVVGLDAVLAEMNRAFQALTSIHVDPLNVFSQGNVVAAELDITLDSVRIKVVDILEFSADGKILAIRAFKG
jgi:ketosteroid isomerase-like protein